MMWLRGIIWQICIGLAALLTASEPKPGPAFERAPSHQEHTPLQGSGRSGSPATSITRLMGKGSGRRVCLLRGVGPGAARGCHHSTTARCRRRCAPFAGCELLSRLCCFILISSLLWWCGGLLQSARRAPTAPKCPHPNRQPQSLTALSPHPTTPGASSAAAQQSARSVREGGWMLYPRVPPPTTYKRPQVNYTT